MARVHDPIMAKLMERILSEYREMPGLAVTLDQAQRLWGCDAATVRIVAEALVTRGALHWSRDRRLVHGTADSRAKRSTREV
jgi:hypothetical protein